MVIGGGVLRMMRGACECGGSVRWGGRPEGRFAVGKVADAAVIAEATLVVTPTCEHFAAMDGSESTDPTDGRATGSCVKRSRKSATSSGL